MKIWGVFVGFFAVALAYIIVLLLIARNYDIYADSVAYISVLPALISLSLLSYIVRYCRWHFLLFRSGQNILFIKGLFCYISGFALTATPGKVGELVRIRYFSKSGVPPWRVISAFIFERAFDLISVLLISAFAIRGLHTLVLAFCSVLLVLVTIGVFAIHPRWLSSIAIYLRLKRLNRISSMCLALRDGVSGCRSWMTPLDISVSLLLGLIAACLNSFSFVWLLIHLGVSIPVLTGMAIYPMSMLVGAASMLPGGVGSTETAIVAILSNFDVPLWTATVAAIGIRLSTLWFAVICGLAAITILEFTPLFKLQSSKMHNKQN